MNVTKQLYQWDTGQKLTECTGIYVDYLIGDEVYRVEITDGTCIIPDELLQTSGRYKVWECMADNTLREFAFKVLPRPIPPNYVFTPTEQLTFEGLVQKETNKFNTNAIEKLNAYNANADNRVAEFNAQTEQIQADVSELKSDLVELPMRYRGNVIELGYTSFGECKAVGYYSFEASDVNIITDFPTDTFLSEVGTKSGLLIVYPLKRLSTITCQMIIDELSRTWFRINTNSTWRPNVSYEPKINENENFTSFKLISKSYLNKFCKDFDIKSICGKKTTGSGGQYVYFDTSAEEGDTVRFGVVDATYESINYIEVSYRDESGNYTKIQNAEIGKDYSITAPVNVTEIRFYMSATGTSSITAYALNESNDSIVSIISRIQRNISSEFDRIDEQYNTLFVKTQTNTGSAYLNEVSPIEHDIQLEFTQKNLFNPKCELNLSPKAENDGYVFSNSMSKNANTINVSGLSAITISGSMNGLNSGLLRYIFSAGYPKVGEPTIASGSTNGGTLSVPVGAKYFTWFTGSISITEVASNVMINTGSSALDYVPYYETFDMYVADDGNLTNAETVTVKSTGDTIKSRSPQMYIRIINASGISIKQTYCADAKNILAFDYSKESVSLGYMQENVKKKSQSIAIGRNNLSGTTEGNKNITVGFDNMYQTSGSRNTSIGYHALFRNTTANDGTAVGAEALDDNTSGLQNTACGAYSLQRNSKGSNNTAVGFKALNGTAQHNVFNENAEYNGNTAIGVNAMVNKGSGNNNTAIGYQTMTSNNNVNGCIALGYNAQCEKDNQMMLGGSNITEVVMCGNKKIIFNSDGTVTWEAIN